MATSEGLAAKTGRVEGAPRRAARQPEASSLRANLRERPVPASTTARKMPDKAPKSAGEASVGQREKNKIDKLKRIKAAARELSLSNGFHDATTRAIASRAGGGPGAVLIHPATKRDQP